MTIMTEELGELYNETEKFIMSKIVKFHYSNLNIKKNASKSEIKKSYRKLSLKYHPDKSNDSNIDENTKKFIIIKEAYECLYDEESRENYDNEIELVKSHKKIIRMVVIACIIFKYTFKALKIGVFYILPAFISYKTLPWLFSKTLALVGVSYRPISFAFQHFI